MPRIFDLFLFDDELDILESRFLELESVPGLVHVICEAPVTFRGARKPLYFWENKSRFSQRERWNHVRVESREIWGKTPKAREVAMREYLLHGIHGDPGDILLFGDVCDIPDREILESLATRKMILPAATGSQVACYYKDVTTIAEMPTSRSGCA